MKPEMSRDLDSCDDALTLGAMGIAAYILADVVHECLGHGVACVAAGGRITLLTSVLFRSEPWSRMTDAAGPSANLLFGFLLWIALRCGKGWPVQTRFFLLLGTTFNLFWGTGYLIYSGIANTGDWVFAIQGFQPFWLWRSIFVVVGIVLYGFSMSMLGLNLGSFVSGSCEEGARRSRLWLFIPYIATGIAACIAALLYRDDRIAALKGAAQETFVTNLGLLAIPLWFRRNRTAVSSPPNFVTRRLGWILSTAVVFVAFAGVLGRGLKFHQ
jgi:hypothetical protein